MALRILCIGGRAFTGALRSLGHAVLGLDYAPDAEIRRETPFTIAQLHEWLAAESFAPDALLYCDNGNLPLLLDPQNAPYPTVFYSIDTYCNPWHVPYAQGFDHTLVAQKDHVRLFTDDGVSTRWFPLFSARNFPDTDFAKRDIPVAFVGTLGHKNNPARLPFLRAFRARHPLVMVSGDYGPVFTRSRIALNQTAFGELNFRCFEAMACGAALLMETCDNGLEELFTPGESILPTYTRGNAAQAAAIAASYLAKPAVLADIARAGQALARSRHSRQARAAELVELLAGMRQGDVQRIRRGSQLQRRAALVRAAFGVLSSELTAPGMRAYREFYARQCLGAEKA